MSRQTARTVPVRRIEDIPRFASGAEERAFWDTHCLVEEFWDTAPVPKESIAQRARRRAEEPALKQGNPCSRSVTTRDAPIQFRKRQWRHAEDCHDGTLGTYVSVEPFHLFRCLDEKAFRFNTRHTADADRMARVVRAV